MPQNQDTKKGIVMSHILIEHKVKDFTAWKVVFDENADLRRSAGEKSYHIFRPNGSSNDVTLLFEWSSLKEAEKFFASLELKSAMQRAGVVEAPKIQFVTEAAKGTA
jgi:hypothetical protein